MENQNTKVITGKCRVSFPHLLTPDAIEGQEKKYYSVSMMIPKDDTVTLPAVKAAMQAAIEKGKATVWGGTVPAKLQKPIEDGDAKADENKKYDNMRGFFLLKCKSVYKVDVVDNHLKPITDSEELYGGMYGRASVVFAPYSKAGNQGMSCYLNAFQKLADGEPFGDKASAAADFGDGLGEKEAAAAVKQAGGDLADFLGE